MGNCNSSKGIMIFPHFTQPNDIKFIRVQAPEANSTRKTIKLLTVFNKKSSDQNPLKNIPKLITLITDRRYNVDYAFMQNDPTDNHSATIYLIFDSDNMKRYVVYSNFGKSEGPHTVHGEMGNKLDKIRDEIIRKFEENEDDLRIANLKLIKEDEDKKQQANKDEFFEDQPAAYWKPAGKVISEAINHPANPDKGLLHSRV